MRLCLYANASSGSRCSINARNWAAKVLGAIAGWVVPLIAAALAASKLAVDGRTLFAFATAVCMGIGTCAGVDWAKRFFQCPAINTPDVGYSCAALVVKAPGACAWPPTWRRTLA